MFHFLCWLKSWEDAEHAMLPREIIFKICRYCLPPLEALINQTPLNSLIIYAPLFEKEEKNKLIELLSKRHMNKLNRSLGTRLRIRGNFYTPQSAAIANRHINIATLLDPEAINNFTADIAQGYEKLWE